MLLLLQRQWSLDGVLLLHRLTVDVCKNLCQSCLKFVRACVVAGAAEILSPSSSCGKAFQTQMHLEPCHEGRQTKPFVQNAKAARLQTFSFNLSSCPPAYGCPSTRHSSNVLL